VEGIFLSIAMVATIVIPISAIAFFVGSPAFTLTVTIPLIIFSSWWVFLPRIRMERKAKELLAKMPEHDSKIIYLNFTSALPNAKRAAMNSKISEIEQAGWTFLKASEAGLHKTSFSSGGGLNLHFIRELTKSSAAAS
jgi:hypothetical protein